MSHWDVIVKRSLEHAFALIMLFSGLDRLWGGSVLMGALSPPLALAWGLLGVISGVLVIAGLHLRRAPVAMRAVESVGWHVAMALCFGGPLALWITTEIPLALALTFLDDVLIGSAAGLRIWFLYTERRAEREVVERLRADREGR